MQWTVRDVMTAKVRTVGPEMPLAELERRLIEEQMSGFPVVEGDEIVGIVSRSDVVRQLCVEQSVAEQISDFYGDAHGSAQEAGETFAAIAQRVGARLESLRVRDVMIRGVIGVRPDASLEEAARLLVEKRIHRVPVVEEGRLRGILSSLDLVRLFADGRVRSA